MIDVYEMVNERILALLDQGVSPWRKPWAAAAQRPPQNLLKGSGLKTARLNNFSCVWRISLILAP